MDTTYIDPDLCTYATCDVKIYGQINYIPSLGGNAFYLSLFSLFLVIQIFLGIRYRTWGFLASMLGGIVLEVIGYIGRILLHNNVFNFNYFIIYLVCLTIGPAFIAAAIYLCLARIIVIYGNALSYFKPRSITCFFILCDFISLLLQAAGGALAATTDDGTGAQIGINIMIAGLATQVASAFAFLCLCAQFAWCVRRRSHMVNQNSSALRRSGRFRYFLYAIGIATIAVLTRCCFRVAELSDGFRGSLANNQVSFMVLDGAMMVVAVFLLKTAHPGFVMGSIWKAAGFHLRTKKGIPVSLTAGSSPRIASPEDVTEDAMNASEKARRDE